MMECVFPKSYPSYIMKKHAGHGGNVLCEWVGIFFRHRKEALFSRAPRAKNNWSRRQATWSLCRFSPPSHREEFEKRQVLGKVFLGIFFGEFVFFFSPSHFHLLGDSRASGNGTLCEPAWITEDCKLHLCIRTCISRVLCHST